MHTGQDPQCGTPQGETAGTEDRAQQGGGKGSGHGNKLIGNEADCYVITTRQFNNRNHHARFGNP